MTYCNKLTKTLTVLAPLTVFTTTALAADKPNMLVVWGDDIGQHNISGCNHGIMGYETPHIDRIAKEGAMFIHYCAVELCYRARLQPSIRYTPVPYNPDRYTPK